MASELLVEVSALESLRGDLVSAAQAIAGLDTTTGALAAAAAAIPDSQTARACIDCAPRIVAALGILSDRIEVTATDVARAASTYSRATAEFERELRRAGGR